jgi:hypothetical protein
MFLDKPDIASRYPNRLTSEMRASVFDRSYREEIYHVAAYTLYRIKLLIGNKRIDGRYSKLRWHIMMAIKYYVCGDNIPSLGSSKIKRTCSDVEKFVSGNDDETVKAIRDLCASIVDINDIPRDKLRASSLVPDVRAKARAARQASSSPALMQFKNLPT